MTPREANPIDAPEPPKFNAYDVVGMVSAAILVWLSLALWFGWI